MVDLLSDHAMAHFATHTLQTIMGFIFNLQRKNKQLEIAQEYLQYIYKTIQEQKCRLELCMCKQCKVGYDYATLLVFGADIH